MRSRLALIEIPVLSAIIVSSPLVAFAQAKLSISGAIPGTDLNVGSTICPTTFISNFYDFALMIGGVLAFGAIVYGGVLYAASGGNPSMQSEGKEWIKSALVGLLLLAGVYTVLNIINPNLVNLSLPQLSGSAPCTGVKVSGSTGFAPGPAGPSVKTTPPPVKLAPGQCGGGQCQTLPNCTAGARVSCGGASAMVNMLNNCLTQQDPNASYRVSEGYPPTPSPTGAPTHTSRGHNNGCSIDVVLTGSATCQDVAAMRAAVTACGGDTEQEYKNCPGYVQTQHRTGDHLHINAPHKGRDTGSC